MYFNRKHGAAQDRPAIFLHYSSSVSISNFVPSRNRKCRSRRRGLPRSPTIEIICFLPSGTKRLFFRSEKQKRSYRTAFFPLLPFFNFSVYYHGNSMQFPCLYHIPHISTAFSGKPIHFSPKTANILHLFTFPLYTITETPDFCVKVYFCLIVRFFPQSPSYQRHPKTKKLGSTTHRDEPHQA